jgi:hypothetical protein
MKNNIPKTYYKKWCSWECPFLDYNDEDNYGECKLKGKSLSMDGSFKSICVKNYDLSKAINIVFNKLSKLSDEDFRKQLEYHKDGDIAKIILVNANILI